jgi:hypothetical protein
MNMKWELVEMLKAFAYAKSRDITEDINLSIYNVPEEVSKFEFKIVWFSDRTVILVARTKFYIGTPVVKETQEYYITQICSSSGWLYSRRYDTLPQAQREKSPDERIMKVSATLEEVE